MSKRRHTDISSEGEDLCTTADPTPDSPINHYHEEGIHDVPSPSKRSRVEVASPIIVGGWADGRDLYIAAADHTRRLSPGTASTHSSRSQMNTSSAKSSGIDNTKYKNPHLTSAQSARGYDSPLSWRPGPPERINDANSNGTSKRSAGGLREDPASDYIVLSPPASPTREQVPPGYWYTSKIDIAPTPIVSDTYNNRYSHSDPTDPEVLCNNKSGGVSRLNRQASASHHLYRQPSSQKASASSGPRRISSYLIHRSPAQPVFNSAHSSTACIHDHQAEVEHLRQRLRNAEDRFKKYERDRTEEMGNIHAQIRVLMEFYEDQVKVQRAQIIDLRCNIAVLEKQLVHLQKRAEGSSVGNYLQDSLDHVRKLQHQPGMFATLNKSVKPSHFTKEFKSSPGQQDPPSSLSVFPSAKRGTLSSNISLDECETDHYVRGDVSHIDYSKDIDVELELELFFQGLRTYDDQFHSQGLDTDFDEGKEAEWAYENIEGDLDVLVGSFQEIESERLEEDEWMECQESLCEEDCEEDHLFEWECEGAFDPEPEEHWSEALLAEEEEIKYYVEMYYHDLELLKNPLDWNGDWSFDVEDYRSETEPEEGDWVLFNGTWIRYQTDIEDEERMEVDDDRVSYSTGDGLDSSAHWEDDEYW